MKNDPVGDWMYTIGGTAVHWSPSRSLLGEQRWSICNREVEYGTGSQEEYEKAARMIECANCTRKGAPTELHKKLRRAR